MRKECKLEVSADIEIFYEADSTEFQEAIQMNLAGMREKLKKRFIDAKHMPSTYPKIASSDFKILGHTGKIHICHVGISFNREKLLASLGGDVKMRDSVEELVQTCGVEYVRSHSKDGVFSSKLDGKAFSLKEGDDYYFDGFKTRAY
jgi:hypothetical protein